MKIIKLSILLILTIITLNIFGQDINLSKKIVWQAPKRIKINENDKISLLSFENSINDSPFGFLPLFFEKVPLNGNNLSAKVVVQNDIYISLSPEEANLITNKEVISPEISVTTKIFKERDHSYIYITVLPFRKNDFSGKIEKLISFDLSIKTTPAINTSNVKKQTKQSSVLSNGNWYKIAVKTSGIYKITYTDLSKMNIDMSSLLPQNIALFGNGGGMLPELNSDARNDDLQENAIQVVDGNDGSFDPQDYILFYAKGPNEWKYDSLNKQFNHYQNIYSDYAYYFINTDAGIGLKKRIQVQPSSSSTPNYSITTFPDYAYWERDLVNLINSGKQWYGETFDIVTNYTIPFVFPDINNSQKVLVRADLAARSTTPSTFTISCGSNSMSPSISAVTASFTDSYAYTANDTFSFVPSSSSLNLNISYSKPLSSSIGWLNYLELNALRNLNFSGSQMSFRNFNSSFIGGYCKYNMGNATASVKIWDVTDIFNCKSQEVTLTGNTLSFNLLMDKPQEFIAFNGSLYNSVETIGKIENQNLHSEKDFDMVIVSHPQFLGQSQQIANLHEQQQNLSVYITTPDQIYNEYSSGAQDITAIRDFLKQMYDKSSATHKLKYLLLFGDGSFDPKKRIADNTNLVPAYEANNSIHPALSFVTDDYFGLFDDNEGIDAQGALDIGIGRFPVSNKEEADALVNKALRYSSTTDLANQAIGCSNYGNLISNFGDWRNVACFVADDEDGDLHISDADHLATYVKTNFKQVNVDKIYFDAYKQISTPGGQRYPDVTEAIDQRINKGAFIINYTGHGGELGWAHERVIEVSDINKWANLNNMPIFVTATCEFSRFDNPGLNSAGELVLTNPTGGGISLFTTTRLAYSNSNFSLNLALYSYFYHKNTDGKYYTMSDVLYHAKNDNGNNLYIRNFVLLGDPALTPSYPKEKVTTTFINTQPANLVNDTIKALSKVTISGSIVDVNGNKITDFNGTVFPQVYDKPLNITTLSNDGANSPPFTFSLQKNILYKGKAKVQNGDFSFSFIVPKDIAYQFGYGRISYYAKNDVYDAAGYYDQIVVGGIDTNQSNDISGPSIKMYLNNAKFVNGGITNENPLLFVNLIDSGGVNTVGNGIGHDLTATLDNVTNKPYVLNDYYEAELDSYQKGLIKYPFYGLAEGAHNLKIKVWDVYNNSSESYIDFIVAESSELALKHVLNYPNPFTTTTSFYFEHNQPCCYLDVQIQIFTISGKLIKTIQTMVATDGYRNEPIVWDGKDDFGDNIGRGVYLYKLRVKKDDGKYAEKLEKLVILK
ncbi:MAG: type IX secretion system sortase PorU [Bacteroidota bacterium]